jgi:tRNA 2-selenouridine synthase SelU
MFGFSAFAALPFASVISIIIPPVIIEIDTHDGGKRKKDEEEYRRKEAAKAKARRDEVLALFEQIVEGKPRIAEEIAEPFVIVQATKQAPAIINYDAMLADLDRVNRIYNEHIEMDDEDVIALL